MMNEDLKKIRRLIDKIDKQIFNDPQAIAKAAIEAYREGRKDSSKIDLDFD